jgi:FkbM family methyltransferase
MNLPDRAIEDVRRAEALIRASVLLLDADEAGLALAGLERAESLHLRLPRVKRARAIALAQLARPLEGARALLEELALAPDDVDAFRTYVGMMDRVPEIRALPEGSFFRRLLRRLDHDAGGRLTGHGHSSTLERAAHHLAVVLAHGPSFEAAYHALADDASRELMLDVAAFQALGDQRVRLPFDIAAMLEFIRRAEAEALRERDVVPASAIMGGSVFGRFSIDLWDAAPLGLPIRALTSVEQLASWAHIGEYDLAREDVRIGPRPGDVVIDGGACYGDTALWLAHRIGPAGRVYGFEFMPAHLEVFRRNMEMNPELAARVELVDLALHRTSGLKLSFVDAGPGSRLGSQPGATATTTIDEFVRQRGLERVDFIKLDIEGAELDALVGAEETIRRFRPRLAVCVYHKWEDLGVLPAHILSKDLGYELRLGHFTPIEWGTVLFAMAR